ncbi:MAG: hypothetical protein HC887_11235 [Desulfobacteraceae bacterium]|nr:hypothetical protein [Desulfobacteraceae bacterium]
MIVCAACFEVSIAGEKAIKEECVVKCKEVAKIIQEKGLDAGIAAVKQPNSPFIWKDSYVFIMHINGIMLAHPITPKTEGQNRLGLRDINGKAFAAEYVAIGKEKGEGWVDYMWKVPNTEQVKPKTTYVYKVPGQDILVLAGVYAD